MLTTTFCENKCKTRTSIPKTVSSLPPYHTYHSESPDHDTNNCWALKNKIQDLIEAKEIEFDAPEKPNVISALMPKHGHNTNAIEEQMFVTSVDELITPLLTIKVNLLNAVCSWAVMKAVISICH